MPITQGLIPLRDRVTELGRIYAIAGKAITDELLRFDIGDFKELKAMKTEDRIDSIIKKLNRAVIRWSQTATPEAYRKAADVSKIRLEILGAEIDQEFPPITHRNTVDNDIDKTVDVLIKANMSIKPNVMIYLFLARKTTEGLMQIQEFDLRDEEVIAGLLDDAIREGSSRGKLEKLIRIHLKRDLFERKFININGKSYDMIKYGKMVARTRLRTVQSEAVKNMANQFDNDLIEISSHETHDSICLSFDGKTFSLSGNTPGYETMPLDGWPPYHPNCEHFASPTSVEAIEARGRRND